MIAVCKCHPKFTPGGAETGTSAGGEGQEYEEVDGDGGGVAVSDPTYMEVDGGGGRGGGTTRKPLETMYTFVHVSVISQHTQCFHNLQQEHLVHDNAKVHLYQLPMHFALDIMDCRTHIQSPAN